MACSPINRLLWASFGALLLLGAAAQDEVRRDLAVQPAPSADARHGIPNRPIFGRDRLDETSSVVDLLIHSPKVALELKLSPETRQAIADAIQTSTPDMTRYRNRLRDANSWVARGSAGPEVLDQARQAIREVEARRTEVVRARLSRSQYRRLLQIAIQQKGYRSLAMPDVAAEVELLPDQEESIRTILADRVSQRAALVDRLQARVSPAEQQRYDRILQKERAGERLGDDEYAFMRRWFAAREEQGRQLDLFEDRIDLRIFNVLSRTQKQRFRRLVGELVETEGPLPPTNAGSESPKPDPRAVDAPDRAGPPRSEGQPRGRAPQPIG